MASYDMNTSASSTSITISHCFMNPFVNSPGTNKDVSIATCHINVLVSSRRSSLFRINRHVAMATCHRYMSPSFTAVKQEPSVND